MKMEQSQINGILHMLMGPRKHNLHMIHILNISRTLKFQHYIFSLVTLEGKGLNYYRCFKNGTGPKWAAYAMYLKLQKCVLCSVPYCGLNRPYVAEKFQYCLLAIVDTLQRLCISARRGQYLHRGVRIQL